MAHDHKPQLQAPPGACDTHIHIYGPGNRYPVAATNVLPVPKASAEDYLAVMTRLNLSRAVVVQPSAYGSDNRCTLDGIRTLGLSRARGVAVVGDSIKDDELASLNAAGIRGARFHMLPGGILPWSILENVAARVHALGWHIQLQMDGRDLPKREAMLKRLPGGLVIDHTGKFLEPVGVDHPGFRSLMELVEGGRCWVKLSAPYETSKVGPPHFDDVGVLAKALVKAAPERMLWASNWPHPSAQGKTPQPDDAALLDVLLDWVDAETARRKILVDNPAEVYGFDRP